MLLVDVNVLVYAHREDTPRHAEYHRWVESMLAGPAAYAVSPIVLSCFLRIVTHRQVFNPPTPLETALAFVGEIRERPNCVELHPGPRHWNIFTRLCRGANAKGNLVPNAYLAALAIKSGSEWITTDRDYARFPGLRWRHPLE